MTGRRQAIPSPWQGEVGAKRRVGVGPKTPRPAGMVGHARRLRRRMTDAEKKLWSCLRNRRLDGLKFRRQHPIGPYVLDFYCAERALAIELDGGQHAQAERRLRDAARTRWLASKGIRVVRYWNIDVLRNIEGVLDDIRLQASAAGGSTPTLTLPLPGGGKAGGESSLHFRVPTTRRAGA